MRVRKQVLWIGPSPSANDISEFERRDLVFTLASGPLTEQDFASSCAVVFSFDANHKGDSIGFLKTYATTAGDHGLLIIVQAETEEQIRMVQGSLGRVPDWQSRLPDLSRPLVLFSIGRPAFELAERAARHPAGPPFNSDLKIDGSPPLKSSESLLLRRSFADCLKITLKTLDGGLSSARVFEVFAEFPPGEAASFPLPYFAKIDFSKRILTEYEAYDEFVNRYVPFNQRPNIDLRRCLLGSGYGILVGDFVDNSIALEDIISPTGARPIIHSLFDDALRGWRQQAFVAGDRVAWDKIRPLIFHTNNIKSTYVELARSMGATMSQKDLVGLLDGNNCSYRRGPQHGDLTAKNIRVRNGEAVLIDFYSSKSGAIVADLACLEVAICFCIEGNAPYSSGTYAGSTRFTEWQSHIDRLFRARETGQFTIVPPVQKQLSKHDWMWSSCQQLRSMAVYIEPKERAYKYMLAAYLLRMATFPDDESKIDPNTPDAVVRGYAYVVAERIITDIVTENGSL